MIKSGDSEDAVGSQCEINADDVCGEEVGLRNLYTKIWGDL